MRIRWFILSGLLLALAAPAMDRWAALSMLESGDNDKAVGPGGEISRFQIQRVLWADGDPTNSQTALATAQEIMRARLVEFESGHKRPATDFEFYILWNAPAYLLGKPEGSKIIPGRIAERAGRFVNLVQADLKQTLKTNLVASSVSVTNAP